MPIDPKVQAVYDARIDAMTPREKIARSMKLLAWHRNAIGRQIVKERGPMSEQELKLRIGLRMYAAEPEVVKLIKQRLHDVSR